MGSMQNTKNQFAVGKRREGKYKEQNPNLQYTIDNGQKTI